MNPIRLVVSDVDGTLVDKDKRLTVATIAAVARLRAAGIGFTIISARPKSGVMPLADALAIDVPLAAFNGGIVFRRDGWEGEHHFIDAAVARGAVVLARAAPVDLWVFARDQWFATRGEGTHADRERVAADQAPVVRGTFDDLIDAADKITFVSDDPRVLAGLHADCDANGWATRATIAQSQTYYLDITARAANKGDGIVALAAAQGVDLAATAAIGDQANDMAMLERAGLAIAMGNAPDAVRRIADAVTRGNDADGVAHAIDTLILPRTGVPA